MKETEYQACCEMGLVAKRALRAEGGDGGEDFIAFLRYCSGRLNKGVSVQAIWRDFQKKAQ